VELLCTNDPVLTLGPREFLSVFVYF
jgi:hypothetical protein